MRAHLEAKKDFLGRPFLPKDHALLMEWWAGHKWPTIPLSSLPENGVVVELEGKPLVAGFVYRTDSDIALVEWIVSDPKSSPFDRAEALDFLISQLTEIAKENGARLALTFVRNDRLIARYQEHGYIVSEQHTTLIKELKWQQQLER